MIVIEETYKGFEIKDTSLPAGRQIVAIVFDAETAREFRDEVEKRSVRQQFAKAVNLLSDAYLIFSADSRLRNGDKKHPMANRIEEFLETFDKEEFAQLIREGSK